MYDSIVFGVLYSFDLPRDNCRWQMGISLFRKLDDVYVEVEVVLASKPVSDKERIREDAMWVVYYYRWSLDVIGDEFFSNV